MCPLASKSSPIKNSYFGVPVMAQWKRIWLVSMRTQVRSLASVSGLRTGVAVVCVVGCRGGSDLALLWLRRRPAATPPTGPLAWEPPYATGVALKFSKKKKKAMSWLATYMPNSVISHMIADFIGSKSLKIHPIVLSIHYTAWACPHSHVFLQPTRYFLFK